MRQHSNSSMACLWMENHANRYRTHVECGRCRKVGPNAAHQRVEPNEQLVDEWLHRLVNIVISSCFRHNILLANLKSGHHSPSLDNNKERKFCSSRAEVPARCRPRPSWLAILCEGIEASRNLVYVLGRALLAELAYLRAICERGSFLCFGKRVPMPDAVARMNAMSGGRLLEALVQNASP